MGARKSISNSFNVNTIEDGESPYFADLDNEMDSVLCNASGYTTSEQALTTNINYVKGITSLKPYTSIVCSIDGVDLSSSYVEEASPRSTFKASVNLNTGAVVITVRNNKSVEKVVVDIAVTADGQTRNLSFTINGIRPGANGTDAVILSLVPSVNEIVKKKDGTYSPTANTYITCAVKKRVGNGTISDAPSSEYTLKYILNETGGEQTYSSTAIKASDVTKNVVFILYDKAGTPNVLDRETVGLITDGNDSAVATAVPSAISVPCTGDAISKVISAVSQDISFGMYVGNNAATVSSVLAITVPSGVTVTSSGNTRTITVAQNALESSINGGVVFRVDGTYGGKTFSSFVTIALVCARRGAQGNMGRFPYFAAIWNDQDSTQLFTADDTKTPFFAVLERGQYHYYVYKGETNFADKSMNWLNSSTIGAPSSKNNNYEMMYDDFSYIITRCIFGDYAHFGASIINGDFLISQYGYMRGFGEEHVSITDGSQYMNMEANDPYGEGDLFNDQTKFLYNNGSLVLEVNPEQWMTLVTINKTISANKYYTLMCEGESMRNVGDTLRVKVTANSVDIAEAQGFCMPSGGYVYMIFKPTANATSFTVKACVSNSQNADDIQIQGLYVREAQFVPNVCIDMLRGKLAANDIIARGKLCMDSAYYENNIMLYNDRRITVKNESFICLSDQASNIDVVLPSPSSCQGRQIEIFTMSPSWTLRWNGATGNDYFLNPYDSNGTPPAMAHWGNGNGKSLESHTQYLRLYSNGSAWVVLCVNWEYTQ